MPVNTLYTDGDNSQLRQVIFASTPKAVEQTKSIARQFKGNTELETCKNIFNFLKNKIHYLEDGFHQKVKLPSALLRERKGDCKSYSVFTYAILYNLGIPCQYVLVSYNDDPTPSHIYVVTDSGIIIDAVWGKFNSEKTPKYKFYKKISDMKISTISGIKGGPIGCNTCNTKMGAVQGNSDQWYRDNKDKLNLSLKNKANNYGKKIPYAPIRGLFRKFIEQNGGGIATSIYRNVYVSKPIYKGIPSKVLSDLINTLKTSAKSKGVKFPSEVQMSQIGKLSSVEVNVSTELNSGALKLPTATTGKQAQLTLPQAWDKVMGSQQYYLHQTYYMKPFERGLSDLKAKYTIPASKEANIKAWKQVLVNWYNMGGNPYELYESVMEGKTKTPRGKDANYMLMVAKSRGLKGKDIGLIIRGVVSAFGGDKFNWGQEGTYIFGYKNSGRIGEPASTTATITAYLSLAIALWNLLSKVYNFVDAKIKEKKGKEQITKLETSGWIRESDYIKLPTPRPLVVDYKQIIIPKTDVPDLEEVGNVVEELENAFGSSNGKPAVEYGPETKKQFSLVQKQGTFSPNLNQAVKDAETDKGTAEWLALASKTTKAIPQNVGDVVVSMVKVDYSKLEKGNNDGTMTAGFGNIILPLLIGGGVLMALNTAKKQKKNG